MSRTIALRQFAQSQFDVGSTDGSHSPFHLVDGFRSARQAKNIARLVEGP